MSSAKFKNSCSANKSYVCVGLDSDFSKIPSCLKQEANPIVAFNKEIIAHTKDIVGCYKPNFAFYLSAGKLGLDALNKTMEIIPNDIPVILDCKIGDIGNTVKHYGNYFFNELKADAITVNPLMGSDAIDPLLEYEDKLKFVLVLTSNKSSLDYLQKNNLYNDIAGYVNKVGHNQLGAVTGATKPEELTSLRKLMPQTWFLIPGIGAQGGDTDSVVKNAAMAKDDARFVINSSRGIIFASSEKDFAQAARQKTLELKKRINEILANI